MSNGAPGISIPAVLTPPPPGEKPRCLLVMAGGTGGHIIPGLAVADVMRYNGWRVYWLGNPAGMEGDLVGRRGFEMLPLKFSGLRGKGFLRTLFLPVTLVRAMWQAWRAMRRVRPDVVLGMGGYASVPGGLVAALSLRPLVLHEQNSIAGWSNRLLAYVARRRLCGFPDALPRAIWVGNPVRAKVAALAPPEERYAKHRGQIHILVLGGSQGARALNQALPPSMELIPPERRPSIVHQSGAAHLAELQANYAKAGVAAKCVAFIRDMAAAYAWADVVVCRAGASTIAELAAAGVASVLVPFPHAVDDHQTANANFLARSGAAILLAEGELRPERLAQVAYMPRPQLLQMALCARKLGKPDAASVTAEICMELAK